MTFPKRMTPEIEKRLDEIAQLKAKVPTFATLARETGLTSSYLRQIVAAKVQILTSNALSKGYPRRLAGGENICAVSHETKSG